MQFGTGPNVFTVSVATLLTKVNRNKKTIKRPSLMVKPPAGRVVRTRVLKKGQNRIGKASTRQEVLAV